MGRQIASSAYGFALIRGENDVLLGRVRQSALGQSGGPVEAVMEPGPSTIRPHVPVEEVRHQMEEHELQTMLVTSPEGRLIGVIRREDVGLS